MLNHVIYGERPVELEYMKLPDGKADVYLRKNIQAVEDGWAADEAYMRCNYTYNDVETNFDRIFDEAAAWKQGDDEPKPTNLLERVEELERENATLVGQLTDTQLALCELYEMIGG